MPTLVPVDGHGSVSLVVPWLGGVGTVDGDLVVVGAQSMAVGVSIGEQAALRVGEGWGGGGVGGREGGREGEGREGEGGITSQVYV